MTDTNTAYADLTTLDVSEINLNQMGAYEEAQTFTPIAPGKYRLQMPAVIQGKAIDVAGTKALEFSLEGLTVAEGAFAGRKLFNQRVSTLPIKAKGKTLNATDAWDLLINFGLASKEAEPTAAEYVAGMSQIQGLTTPNPVEITVRGSYQDHGNPAANKNGYVNVYDKAFRQGAETASVITVTKSDGSTAEVKAKPNVAWRGWAGR
jgi:hypothetical protein